MPRSLPLSYPLANLGRRPGRTALNVVAAALVAAVLAASAAFVRGLERSFAAQGREDVGILLSAGALRDVLRSTVAVAVADLVAADVPGVLHVHGVPAVSPEIHMGTRIRLAADGPDAPGLVRGVTERAFLVHPEVTLAAGRLPGPNEVLVGRLAAARLDVPPERLAPGRTLHFEGATFTIAGIFAAPGTAVESEIWAPLRELQGQVQRDDVSAVFARMQSPADLTELQVFARRRLDLELICIPAQAYYRELAAYFRPIRLVALLMAAAIAVSVILTGANTLNAAVSERTGELATLQALGYGAGALVRALALEALLLAAAGGVAGALLARAILHGTTFRIGMGAFALEADGAALLAGSAGVLALGFLGTLPAAFRMARLDVAAALAADA